MIVVAKSKPAFPKEALPVTFDSFIHVYNAMVLFWGTADFQEYLSKTLISDRENRDGFPPSVLKELHNLQVIHDKMFPQFVKDIHGKTGVWDNLYSR